MTGSFPVISTWTCCVLRVQLRKPTIITDPGDKHPADCIALEKFDFKVSMIDNNRSYHVSASAYVTALQEQSAIGKRLHLVIAKPEALSDVFQAITVMCRRIPTVVS
jgi:hypothetical protein